MNVLLCRVAPFPAHGLLALCTLILAGFAPVGAAEAPPATLVEVRAVAGLRFDPPRFQVAPGAKVTLTLENTDDMAHNLVFVAPEARVEIVNAALGMPITPTSDFIPKSDKVLWHVPVQNPGKTGTLEFTAPTAEGVYPYVCTYPGHGLVMYGAMYVGKMKLPPLGKDANIPELWRSGAAGAPLHAYHPEPPYFYRIFMRDCGPAAIAVALPSGQNYCWDAGACRLRYAWRGGFVDPMPHWRANGDGFAEVTGRIYYRPSSYPLRIGAVEHLPAVKFHGYRLVDRYPEFHYTIDGVEVRELTKPQHHGGLTTTFNVTGAPGPIFFVADQEAGASVSSSAGAFKDGVLSLSPEQARNFSIDFTEIPGREPLAYLSMDDTLASGPSFAKVKGELEPGVKGRAVKFDGKKYQIDTAIRTNDLLNGATIEFWARSGKPGGNNQAILSAKSGDEVFAVARNFGGPGLGLVREGGGQNVHLFPESKDAAPDEWRHVAVTLSKQAATLYLDGQKCGEAPGVTLPVDATLILGSLAGSNLFTGALDELRVFDRVLPEAELLRIYASERPQSGK